MEFGKVDRWIGEHAEEMVSLQAELTCRPALGPENDGAGEWEKANFLEGYLRGHGLDGAEHFDCPDERVPEGTRPNFVVTLPGRTDAPCVWILTHLDVVPPGEKGPDGSWKGWESDPFSLRRAGDIIVGRGVSDDQQAVVSSVFAARGILETETEPPHAVKLLFVADEETGSKFGLQYLLREHGQMFGPDDVIIVPDGGNEEGSMIEVAEKSVLWLEFHVQGRQAHGSRPDLAVNAFRAASRLVYLLDRGLSRRFDRVDHLYEPPYSTFEPTLHKANVPNVNTIPAEDVFCFDCRVLPPYDLDAVLDYVQAQCKYVDGRLGTTTQLTIRNRQDSPVPTSPDSRVVRLLTSAIEKVYGVRARPMGIGGLTLASSLRERGLPAAVWMRTAPSAHQVNEVCHVEHMVGDARVFAHVCLDES